MEELNLALFWKARKAKSPVLEASLDKENIELKVSGSSPHGGWLRGDEAFGWNVSMSYLTNTDRNNTQENNQPFILSICE